VQCRYCQAWNEEDERRCGRCGRRLHAPSPRPAPEIYPLSGSEAPVLEAIPGGELLAHASPEGLTYQRSLFRDGQAGPKVIPIPTLTPVPPNARSGGPESEGRAAKVRRPSSPRSGAHRGADSQQRLDFHAAADSRSAGTQIKTVIYCDAPVALPLHRLMAAAADASMVLTALGLFLAVFFLSGGDIVLSKQNAPFLLGAPLGIALFYRLLWYLANTDTPGMRFAGLRLVNFDGRPPGLEERGLRQAAGALSVLSAGLGLVWAMVDEENLTWHDHISKTFPTPSR
jgi:uncharacterized RDD family membrane protein YckC